MYYGNIDEGQQGDHHQSPDPFGPVDLHEAVDHALIPFVLSQMFLAVLETKACLHHPYGVGHHKGQHSSFCRSQHVQAGAKRRTRIPTLDPCFYCVITANKWRRH
ncbi:hypothetical protein HW555_001300 [Spodoptera exigua]|uniref:Uncharacterized protein n=1 Tax=Spodoptera exigua TaxID=7107 RepID=A0A835GSM3_SPOEX|nr:hypothetical protein HW555_001300 [Spodoptera exigua]